VLALFFHCHHSLAIRKKGRRLVVFFSSLHLQSI